MALGQGEYSLPEDRGREAPSLGTAARIPPPGPYERERGRFVAPARLQGAQSVAGGGGSHEGAVRRRVGSGRGGAGGGRGGAEAGGAGMPAR